MRGIWQRREKGNLCNGDKAGLKKKKTGDRECSFELYSHTFKPTQPGAFLLGWGLDRNCICFPRDWVGKVDENRLTAE